MPETEDHIEVGSLVGDYEITRLIGRGGTSDVWAARRRRLPEKEVAIKVLHLDPRHGDSGHARLRREAEILSNVQNTHIVQILDFDTLQDGRPYLVLELLRGETLRERLRHGRLPVDHVLEIATQIGSALSEAHRLGIVHRDLKPGNIFLCPVAPPSAVREHVKVLDFGISQQQGTETLTQPGSAGGTPQYMSPEQLTGRPLDARSDIFALGAVVYEMLAGRPAFAGENMAAIAHQVVYTTPEPLRQVSAHVPVRVAAAVERAMEKDPARRFGSVTAFMAAFADASFQPMRARPRAVPVRRWVIAAAILLGFATTLGIYRGAVLGSFAQEWHLFKLPWHPADEPPKYIKTAVNAVAVLEFENQRPNDAQNDWYRQALQTTFNTELSKLPQLAVVAPEEIRRTAEENGLKPAAAAERLGVKRFVTGSFTVVGSTIRIDARVVDTTRGVQEAAEQVEGIQDDFLTLQRQLALAMLKQIQVRLTGAQEAALAKPAKGGVDKYRMLLEAEGLTASQAAAGDDAVGPQSRLLHDDATSRLASLFIGIAYAADVSPEVENAARATLEEYRVAQEQGDIQRLAALYVAFPESQRRAVSNYAKNVDQLHIDVSNIKIQPRAHDVLISYTRRDRFIDKETGEPMQLEVRLTRYLVRDGGRWKFAAE